jgi:signal peptidase I
MGKRKNKSSTTDNSTATTTGTATDSRDPAEIRAESFRIAGGRETIEAFVIAFILALLFRAFLAEAFVIPTGSMAPALMGAHKDVTCQQCGYQFQFSASSERKDTTMRSTVVAGTCANCRHLNKLDLREDANHQTFNGDRIVVGKYSYVLNDPERWDVIVFKYPGNPKQNYIKRCVGLPNETLTIQGGDVYTRPIGESGRDEIVRKPADKLLAMRHLVHDSAYPVPSLIAAQYPSRWQPWAAGATEPPTDSWVVEETGDGLTARVDASGESMHWLRYFHRWPSEQEWAIAASGGSLAHVDPYSSRLITDFYAFNSYVYVPASRVFDDPPTQVPPSSLGGKLGRLFNSSGGGYSRGVFREDYQPTAGLDQFGQAGQWDEYDNRSQQAEKDGMHWAGDLMIEADIETDTNAQELVLELVEAGVKFQCWINLETGLATLKIDDAGELREFDAVADLQTANPTAQSGVVAGGKHQLRFSNFDDQLLLWVDGSLVEFDRPTTFDTRSFRTDANNRPYYSAGDPLDAAPVAIGVRGGTSTIRRLKVDRDKYYIATNNVHSGIYDYDLSRMRAAGPGRLSMSDIQQQLADREAWGTTNLWESRRSVSFDMDEDQYFAMGDNSPESLDARCWAGSKPQYDLPRGVNRDAWRWSNASYVPRELLVGKALAVFWPHSWNSPVPFTPNLKRMKLIR